MSKRYDEPIEVKADAAFRGAPLAFWWRGVRYDVDLPLASWREAGEVWDRAAATDRAYFRVLARPAGTWATGDLDGDGFMRSPGAVYDLYADLRRGVWRLDRIWD